MLITNNRAESALAYLRRQVAEMKPGDFLEIDRFDLMDVPSYEHNESTFTAADRILGGLMGSAYTHSYEVLMNGNVRFRRHENTGERRYKEPDHDFRVARLQERGLTR